MIIDNSCNVALEDQEEVQLLMRICIVMRILYLAGLEIPNSRAMLLHIVWSFCPSNFNNI